MSLTKGKQLLSPFSGSFTGSLFGTASYALVAGTLANTSSFFLVGGNSNGTNLTLGSLDNRSLFLIVSGSNRIQINNTGSIVTIKDQFQNSIMTVNDNGITNLITHSIDPTGSPNNGDLYFTSGSFYIGLT